MLEAMAEPPVVTRHVEWGQESVTSVEELAVQLGEAVWVPVEWPPTVAGPEILVMRFPGADRSRDAYHLRGLDQAGRLLIVHGHRRQGGNLESGLRPVPGERFETLARAEDQPPHVVVRLPVFDVHVSGDALSHEATLGFARNLVEVAAAS